MNQKVPGKLTYQLHSGGTSLVSSSSDFSDLYSWQVNMVIKGGKSTPSHPGYPNQDLRN